MPNSRALAVVAVAAAAAVVALFVFVFDGGRGLGRDRETVRPPAAAEADSPARVVSDQPSPRVVATAAASEAGTSTGQIAPPGHAAVALVAKGTREPLAGVAIVFAREPFGPGSPHHRATSDAAGMIALEGIPVGRWHATTDDDYFLVDLRRDFVDVLPTPVPTPAMIALERGALVTGAVVDSRGAPVADAKVRLDADEAIEAAGTFGDSSLRLLVDLIGPERLSASTRPDGRYAIRAVPAGVKIRFTTTHRDYAPTDTEGFEPRAGEACAAPDIVLTEGGSIRVAAATSDGRPVVGAAMRVQRLSEANDMRLWWREDVAPDATTGSDGVAIVVRLRPGVYAVGAQADGCRPFTRSGIVVEDERTTDVAATLEAGVSITGIVVDAAGGPVAGARVEISRAFDRATSTTDDLGRFAVGGLAPGSTPVSVEAAGFMELRGDVTAGPDEVRFVLRPEASVSGQVVDREGRPVRAFRLIAKPLRDPQDSEGQRRSRAPLQRIDVSDPDGRFRVGGLGPATYEIEAMALATPGLGSGLSAPIVVGAGAAVDGVRIEIESTVTLRARVLDAATREPLAGAIASCPVPAAIDAEEENGWRQAGGDSGRSGEDGMIVASIARSARALRFAAEGHAATVIEPVPPASEGGAVEIEVALGRGATIMGTVRDGEGVAIAGALVETVNADRKTITSAEGEYAIAGLEPGEYEIAWSRSTDEYGYVDSEKVTLAADETVRIDFGPGARPGSRVFGLVREGGASVPGLQIGLDSMSPSDDSRRRIVRTDDRGAYEFLSVRVGTWSLGPAGEGSSAERVVDVDGETPLRVDIDLPAGRLVVAVSAAVTREPVPDAHVEVDLGDETRSRKLTGHDGRVEFTHVPSGQATVRVQGTPPYQRRSSRFVPQEREVTIPESGTVTLEILLAEGVALEGRVTGPDGSAARQPRVTLVPADGGREVESARGGLGGDGRYRVEALEPGTYAAIVRAADAATTVFGDVRVAAEEGGRASRRDFALGRGGTVAVRVANADGAPVADAQVTCHAPMAGRGDVNVARGSSNDAGVGIEFRLAPGAYELRADAWVGDGRSGNWNSASAAVSVAEGESVSITLVPLPARDE